MSIDKQKAALIDDIERSFEVSHSLASFRRNVLQAVEIHMPASAPPVPDTMNCQADRDGDCFHKDCPQLRDNEPHATGRHCPNDSSTGRE